MFNRRSSGVLINPGCPAMADAHGRPAWSTEPIMINGNYSKKARYWSGIWSRIMRRPSFSTLSRTPRRCWMACSPWWKGEDSFVQVFVMLFRNIAIIRVCVYSHTFFTTAPNIGWVSVRAQAARPVWVFCIPTNPGRISMRCSHARIFG